MIAIHKSLSASSSNDHLRPIDARRDLIQVADLIELCFSENIDPDGESYIRQMRNAAKNGPYLQWTGSIKDQATFFWFCVGERRQDYWEFNPYSGPEAHSTSIPDC